MNSMHAILSEIIRNPLVETATKVRALHLLTRLKRQWRRHGALDEELFP